MTTADHILRSTQATIGITFTAGDATGAVTYTVTDADGVSVQTGTATNEAPAGYYTFTLAPQATVKTLTIVWSGTWGGADQSITTSAEIVGAHLFTVAELRAFDDAALTNPTTFTDATIREARAGIADFFEQVTGVSFIPRYARTILDGDGTGSAWLPHRQVRAILGASTGSASTALTALTAAELLEVGTYEYGLLERNASWTTGHRNLVVSYEHGYQAVPWEIHRAALIYARNVLVAVDMSDRTLSMTNELGTIRLSIPGQKYPTGIPVVDAALSRYTQSLVIA